MPRSEFFAKLGLFIRDDFLSPETCARFRSEMLASASRKGVVFAKARGVVAVDEDVRRVLRSDVSKATEALIRSQLEKLKPALAKHFQTSLSGFEGPYFLRYRPGDFFKTHRDLSYDTPSQVEDRRVSVIIFLNGAATDSPASDDYTGGALTFYGLLPGEPWESRGFPLEGSRGLLVAFPPRMRHEVCPVISGERFTIAAWFTGVGDVESSDAEPRGANRKRRAPARKRIRA
jgi:predicted 2-oxoglutarate/Fe(II)-dependent dioxygenase YbiX